MSLKSLFSLFCISVMTSNLFGQELADYQWKNRILITYESINITDNAQTQLQTFLFHKNELQERKLVLFHLDGNKLKQIFPEEQVFSVRDIGIEFNHAFEIILIGLDGGIKKRWTSVVKPQKIFDLIDSMPMRRAEMRSKQDNNK